MPLSTLFSVILILNKFNTTSTTYPEFYLLLFFFFQTKRN